MLPLLNLKPSLTSHAYVPHLFSFSDAHIKVMCGRDYIAIRALEDFFKYHNVPVESLHLPNKSCRAQREVINSVPYYMSRISKDEYLTCGGKPLEVQLECYLRRVLKWHFNSYARQ